MINSGCATTKKVEVSVPKTELVYLVPEIIARPERPNFYRYDTTKPLDDLDEFKKRQKNAVLNRTYIQNLNHTIDYYEECINNLNEQKATTVK